MSSFHYREDVEKELARSAGMAHVLTNYAQAGAEHAIAVAPHGGHVGEHYDESIGWAFGFDERGPVASVLSTDWFAHGIEFGSVNNPAYAPLRRGVEATGLRVTDRGRSRSAS